METMKPDATKNNGKAPPPEPRKVTGDPLVDGIPVFELRFCVQNGRDLPYVDSHGGTGTLRARPDRDITYLPKLRHHRVVQRSTDPKVSTKTFYVHETWCTFEPIE